MGQGLWSSPQCLAGLPVFPEGDGAAPTALEVWGDRSGWRDSQWEVRIDRAQARKPQAFGDRL